MDKFIGCMVSLDCGNTLGVYQGEIESIDTEQSSVTLVRTFRNGVPYKLPQVTIRSQDINNLQIIKKTDDFNSSSHSKASVVISSTSATTIPLVSLSSSTKTATTANNIKLDLPFIFSQTKNLQRLNALHLNQTPYLGSKIFPENKPLMSLDFDDNSHDQSTKGLKNRPKTSVTPPNNFGRHQYNSDNENSINHNLESSKNESLNQKKPKNLQNHFTYDDSIFSNPHAYSLIPNHQQRLYSFDGNANFLAPQQQRMFNISGLKGGQTKDLNGKNQSLKISNSFTETYHNNIIANNVPSFRGYEIHSPTRKQRNIPKRNNSECFDHCDDDFDVEFDFEKNLALFDKAAVAMELSSVITNHPQQNHQNTINGSNGVSNGKANRSQNRDVQIMNVINYNSDEVPKFKCDENILRGVKPSRKQIYLLKSGDGGSSNGGGGKLDQLGDRLILGEYRTDAEFIVPGISDVLRDKLFAVSQKLGFNEMRLVEAFGRSVSEAVMQYLGGSTRFEPKNAHQRPTIVFLLGSTNWQSASALNCARCLANRSANVVVYSIHGLNPAVHEYSVYGEELKLFKMTNGVVIKDCIDLQTEESTDLIITTFDSIINNQYLNHLTKQQQQNQAYAINWANRRKAPIFSIEPSPDLKTTSLDYKRSFVCGLPPWFKAQNVGQISLCDVGWPVQIFLETGFIYESPFFDKFFIVLHAS